MKKIILAAFTLSAMTTLADSTVPNARAKAELQRLFFGNNDKTTHNRDLAGHLADQRDCTVRLGSTRWGTYINIEVTEGSKQKFASSGVTNSHMTTQHLKYARDDAGGTLTLSRDSIDSIDERGEDDSRNSFTIKYSLNPDHTANLTSVLVSSQALDGMDDPKEVGEKTTYECFIR